MNSLVAHRVMIALLTIGIIACAVSKNPAPTVVGRGHDGNPSGLDISVKQDPKLNPDQTIATIQEGQLSSLTCLQYNACRLHVEFHYLMTPAPQCSPNSGASDCPSPLPANPPPRVLPLCVPSSGEFCVSVNTNNTQDVSTGSPLTVAVQNDDDGWRSWPANGQFILILSTSPIGTRSKP